MRLVCTANRLSNRLAALVTQHLVPPEELAALLVEAAGSCDTLLLAAATAFCTTRRCRACAGDMAGGGVGVVVAEGGTAETERDA